jgi:hypothetical protein
MQVIESESDIKIQHETFFGLLEKYKNGETDIIIGHKGRSWPVTVPYSKELGIWWYNEIVKGKSGDRYWNAYGLGIPVPNKLNNIVCEINYPVSGINPRIAAVWVKEGADITLIHNGKIGGGKKGIGKTALQDMYEGEFNEVDSDALKGRFTPIGCLTNPRLPYQVEHFVREVYRIKKHVTTGVVNMGPKVLSTKKLKTTFSDEFFGTKTFYGKQKISQTCDHGLVVRSLKETLEKKGFNVSNDRARDLFIFDNVPECIHAFEIKTTTDSQSVYTAVGQLLINNLRVRPKPKMTFVAPEDINVNTLEILSDLSISFVTYSWNKSMAVFSDLDKIL